MADNNKKTETVETDNELQQKLIDAQTELLKLRPEAVEKKKPYTKAEIAEHAKSGHLIGAPNQKLSEGHSEEDLQKWDLWLCAVELKNAHISEIGREWSVPTSITPMKIQKSGKMGNDKAFVWENQAVDFRQRGKDKEIFLNFPQGTVEAGKTYDCSYWTKETGRGQDTKILVHMLVKDFPRVTGAPSTK